MLPVTLTVAVAADQSGPKRTKTDQSGPKRKMLGSYMLALSQPLQNAWKLNDGKSQPLQALRGDIEDEAWTLATAGVKQGGLGMRTARRTAAAAAVASLVGARPLVQAMCADMVDSGLAQVGVLEGLYEQRCNLAWGKLTTGLPESVAEALCSFVERCAVRAEEEWAAVGVETEVEADDFRGGSPGRRPGHGLVADRPAMDDEVPSEDDGLDPSRIQRGLLRILDTDVVEQLSDQFEREERLGHKLRLDELRAASQCHDWLWALGPWRQKALPEDEYVIAVRLRLGAGLFDEDVTCGYCHTNVLDRFGHHALWCAGSCATRGHTNIKDEVLGLALQADPAAEAEPAGLIPERPGLRPADVLCAATTRGQMSALDVGVTMPSPADGAADATERYKQLKLNKYRRFLETMRAQGIAYVPIIWSSWGRPNPDAARVLKGLAARPRDVEALSLTLIC